MPGTEKIDDTDTLRPIDQKLRDGIAAGLKREFDLKLNIPDEEWGLLEASLHRFHRSSIDWRGYLNKGEMAALSGIASKADKLSLAIDQTTQRGLGKILEYELAHITSDQLLAALAVLSKIASRSPKTKDGKKRVGMRYQDDLKADLQLELDDWWKRNSGSPAETEETEVTPFSYFLAQIFRVLPSEVSTSLGHSRTAVSERRRHGAQRQTRDREVKQARDREISEAFKKLHLTTPQTAG